ncbi:MAG: aldose 1-epimerase [Myxococcota bacterium]|nr:aldose 1-epimerase [Myxococcota bacterium]
MNAMESLCLESPRLRLVVQPGAGASISTLAWRSEEGWVPIFRPTPTSALVAGDSSAMSCFLLAPFSNRLTNACFTFAGQEYRLRANAEGGYAIHGCVRERPWRVESQNPTEVKLSLRTSDFSGQDFPFPFHVEVTYGLTADTLTAQLALTNAGDRPMPGGLGFHPYFQRTLVDAEERVELEFSARAAFSELSPEGEPRALANDQRFDVARPIPSDGFDTCFSGWGHSAQITWPGSRIGAELHADSALGHLILYTPPEESFFALEPVSHANNGFNLFSRGIPDSGVKVLEREETLVTGFRLRLSELPWLPYTRRG